MRIRTTGDGAGSGVRDRKPRCGAGVCGGTVTNMTAQSIAPCLDFTEPWFARLVDVYAELAPAQCAANPTAPSRVADAFLGVGTSRYPTDPERIMVLTTRPLTRAQIDHVAAHEADTATLIHFVGEHQLSQSQLDTLLSRLTAESAELNPKLLEILLWGPNHHRVLASAYLTRLLRQLRSSELAHVLIAGADAATRPSYEVAELVELVDWDGLVQYTSDDTLDALVEYRVDLHEALAELGDPASDAALARSRHLSDETAWRLAALDDLADGSDDALAAYRTRHLAALGALVSNPRTNDAVLAAIVSRFDALATGADDTDGSRGLARVREVAVRTLAERRAGRQMHCMVPYEAAGADVIEGLLRAHEHPHAGSSGSRFFALTALARNPQRGAEQARRIAYWLERYLVPGATTPPVTPQSLRAGHDVRGRDRCVSLVGELGEISGDDWWFENALERQPVTMALKPLAGYTSQPHWSGWRDGSQRNHVSLARRLAYRIGPEAAAHRLFHALAENSSLSANMLVRTTRALLGDDARVENTAAG